MASYCYDAWGKILSSSGDLAELNPLRYRGYVYDQETGFYYVESRYYDSAIRRFINADSVLSTGQGVTGHNAYVYCGNNPVVRADIGGNIWHIVAGAAASTLSRGLTYFAKNANYIRKPLLVALAKSSAAVIGSTFFQKLSVMERRLGLASR